MGGIKTGPVRMTFTPEGGSGGYDLTSYIMGDATISVNHLADARSERKGYDATRARFFRELDAVRTLFGATVFHALNDSAFEMHERAVDMTRSFEQAVQQTAEEAEERRISDVSACKREHERLTYQRDRRTRLLADIVEETRERCKKSRRPLPVWFSAAVALVEESDPTVKTQGAAPGVCETMYIDPSRS